MTFDGPDKKTLMVEERVYFPGHKLSLNNSEFILNSPVLFTVQAINVFITGGLAGLPNSLLLCCLESFSSFSWKAHLTRFAVSPYLIRLICTDCSLISAHRDQRKGCLSES